MRSIVKFTALGIVVLVFLFCVSAYAKSNRVQVDPNHITVDVAAMALEDILEVVANATGVQFIIDQELASKQITMEFNRLPLSEGVKKILSSLNHATLEDDSGKLRKVFIFGDGMQALTLGHDIEADETPRTKTHKRPTRTVAALEEGDATETPDHELLTEDEEFESADEEELVEDTISLTEEPNDSQIQHSHVVSRTENQDTEGPPAGQDQEFEGPPESQEAESVGPSDSGEPPSDGPPNTLDVNQGPPMTSESSPMEGPPQD